MLFLLLFCAASAFFLTAWLVRHARRHAQRYSADMPQRFHRGHVPRLGGAAVFAGCSLGWGFMALADGFGLAGAVRIDPWLAASLWGVTFIPVAAGVVEDLTQRLPARYRLLLTMVAATIAVFTLHLSASRVGIPWLDGWFLEYPWIGMAIAILAIGGLPHAFNLIDGYNGLAGMVAFICCMAVAYVAFTVGDRELAGIVVALAGATAGFILWNYPRGLIFAGDGGAYLWGAVISTASIMLISRHPQVSPWFPVLLLIYPIQETLFSIYRKVVRGQSPAMADALHFHQLIYRRIVRGVFHDDEARRMLMRNNRTSPYLWGFAILTVVPAALFWDDTLMLILFILLFIVTYVWAYWSIVRFKLQRWIRP